MSEDREQICRLAIRREGTTINAYIAMPSTMEGAKYVGSIALDLSEAKPDIFTTWKDLMRKATEEFVFDTTGRRIEFGGEQKAPEHERAGNG